jgi:PAS domain S-box-containing protein
MGTHGGDGRQLVEGRSHQPGRKALPNGGAKEGWWDEGDALAYVLSASGFGHWRFDIASGRLTCSDGCRKTLGLDPEDDLTSLEQLKAFVHAEDRMAVDRALERAISDTGEYEIEHRVVTRSRAVRWVMSRGRVCRCPSGGAAMAGITIDITAHKALEAERERLIVELAAERARLRALIDHMPAAVLVSEAPSGRIVLVNRSVETVFPLPHPPIPADSAELFSAWQARHPDGRAVEAHERPIARALRGESVDGDDYLFLQSDGTDRWLRLASAPICDDSGRITGAVGIACDVDREKRAEEALRASENRHRQLFDASVIGIIQSRIDGLITSANDTFLEMLGYTRDDLLAGRLNWRNMTPPEHLEGNERRAAELLETGALRPTEKAYLHKDGTPVPVVIGGTMLAGSRTELVTFILDIRDRKRVEAERESLLQSLERSEERYRLAALALEDAIYDVDLRTQRLNLQSSMYGHDCVTTRTAWAELLHPEDREGVLAALRVAIENNHQYWEAEYRLRRADGEWIVVADRARVVFGDDGRPARMVGAVQDITARRRQQEFERQLIGIVSHDLKNPLNTILLSVETLVGSQELGDRTRRNAVRIQRAAERATRMIRDLLDFTMARLGAGIPIERRWIGLGPMFQTLVDEVRAGHPERAIAFECSGDCGGEFDADRLAQVLTNLIENALKYSPPRSSVDVTLRGESDEVMLCVHNEGPAIPAGLLPRIFEPLQRGEAAFDPTGRSVGLGLYIVKHLVEAHGGRVEVRSSDGEGTDFSVWLPRSVSSRAA